MKKHTKIVLISLAVVGVTATAVSYAGGQFCRNGGDITERVSAALQLNQQQQEKLDLVALQMRKMKREGRTQHQSGRQQMAALLDDASLDQAKALELMQQKHRVMEAQAASMIAVIADFTNTLEPQQKGQLKQLIEQGPRFGGRHMRGQRHQNSQDRDDGREDQS